MKNLLYLFTILSIITLSSCDDSLKNPVTTGTGLGEGYVNNEASVCMTLASLAYVNENNPAYMKDSLKIQLAKTNYATQGKWVLDWGPALSPDGGNMMYAVKDTTVFPYNYAIAVRGTDWCFPFNWKEDIGAIEFDPYPYGGTDDSISHGAMVGLNYLLNMTDSATGKSLITYLNTLPNNNTDSTFSSMFITGHSLGGMLATVLSAWFVDVGYTSKLDLTSYTFAAPSAGNEQFVQHYANIFTTAGAESYRVVNPNDLVPYFYGDIADVIVGQIPTTLPYSVDAVMLAMDAYFIKYNLIYKHVANKYILPSATPTDCGYPPGSLDQYECYVAFNHHTTTYLTLLGAPLTEYGDTACEWER